MAIKIIDLPAETGPTPDDLIVIRDNETGTTRKITVDTLLRAFSYLYSPTGSVTNFAGTTAPAGWLLCDGSAVDRDTYADLFAITGTAYGSGDGSSTFNLPDMRGRTAVGLAPSGSFNVLNNSGGEENHVLTFSEMPQHSHPVNDPGHNHGIYDPGHRHGSVDAGAVCFVVGSSTLHLPGSGYNAVTFGYANTTVSGSNIGTYGSGTGIWIGAQGDNQPHNNMPPYRVLNYIIKT